MKSMFVFRRKSNHKEFLIDQVFSRDDFVTTIGDPELDQYNVVSNSMSSTFNFVEAVNWLNQKTNHLERGLIDSEFSADAKLAIISRNIEIIELMLIELEAKQ